MKVIGEPPGCVGPYGKGAAPRPSESEACGSVARLRDEWDRRSLSLWPRPGSINSPPLFFSESKRRFSWSSVGWRGSQGTYEPADWAGLTALTDDRAGHRPVDAARFFEDGSSKVTCQPKQ